MLILISKIKPNLSLYLLCYAEACYDDWWVVCSAYFCKKKIPRQHSSMA